ncbi:MAG: hypothetical protein K2X27_17210 [Candidatus Obscuribacterales bacterium]|nr:hypothetical protein [Candidatus Obscuribacterales bacterium]
MFNAASIKNNNVSTAAISVENQAHLSRQTLIEKLDSSLLLSSIAGIGISVISFSANVFAGIYLGKALPALSNCPIMDLAAGITVFNLLIMAKTLQAGLKGNIQQALLFGCSGAFLLGLLYSAAGL